MALRLLIDTPEYVNLMTRKQVSIGKIAKIKTVKHIDAI